eukprot:m51a1_g5339 hypothetical protein (192) ;mRNA; f:427524-428099
MASMPGELLEREEGIDRRQWCPYALHPVQPPRLLQHIKSCAARKAFAAEAFVACANNATHIVRREHQATHAERCCGRSSDAEKAACEGKVPPRPEELADLSAPAVCCRACGASVLLSEPVCWRCFLLHPQTFDHADFAQAERCLRQTELAEQRRQRGAQEKEQQQQQQGRERPRVDRQHAGASSSTRHSPY